MLNQLPSAAYLHKRFDYNPITGELRNNGGVQHTRQGNLAGRQNCRGYIQVSINRRSFLAHRIAWKMTYGDEPPDVVDHIDRDQSHNAIHNLRAATRQDSSRNVGVSSRNTSGVKGVSLCPQTGKWKASIAHFKQYIHLGRFDSIEEAKAARRKGAKELYGPFYSDD